MKYQIGMQQCLYAAARNPYRKSWAWNSYRSFTITNDHRTSSSLSSRIDGITSEPITNSIKAKQGVAKKTGGEKSDKGQGQDQSRDQGQGQGRHINLSTDSKVSGSQSISKGPKGSKYEKGSGIGNQHNSKVKQKVSRKIQKSDIAFDSISNQPSSGSQNQPIDPPTKNFTSSNNLKSISPKTSNKSEIKQFVSQIAKLKGTAHANNHSATKLRESILSQKLISPKHLSSIRRQFDAKDVSNVPSEFPDYALSFKCDPKETKFEAIVVPQPSPPNLAHNLDRVLFNPGVHFLRDPRSNVYNFDPSLENVVSIKDFDFDLVPRFRSAAQDSKLSEIAQTQNKRFIGSTSSMTSILTHFHIALSRNRQPSTMGLSKYFDSYSEPFSASVKKPTSFFLRYQPETKTYAIDSDKSQDEEIILSLLGNTLESLLTTPSDTFAKFSKARSDELDPSFKERVQSSYNYSVCEDIVMRSQLDCYDPRLPGTGVFDLKTRAVCAVRYDIDFAQIYDGSHYRINKLQGQFESFEREMYDLIRTSLFKYSLQARIGRMDGIFVAYHNIRELFGFQYLTLNDMDMVFHTSNLAKQVSSAGTSPRLSSDTDVHEVMSARASHIADSEFKISLKMLNELLSTIVTDFPEQSVHVMLKSLVPENSPSNVLVLIHPISEENVQQIQNKALEEADELSKNWTLEQASSTDYDTIDLADESGRPSIDTNEPMTSSRLNGSLWQIYDRKLKTPQLDEELKSTKAYTLDIRNYIDGKKISPSMMPTPRIDQVWTAECAIQPHSDVSVAFSTIFSKNIRFRVLATTPQTERADSEDEDLQRQKLALTRLSRPSYFQKLLRRLSHKGEVYRELWQREHGHKAKVIWSPKDHDSS